MILTRMNSLPPLCYHWSLRSVKCMLPDCEIQLQTSRNRNRSSHHGMLHSRVQGLTRMRRREFHYTEVRRGLRYHAVA